AVGLTDPAHHRERASFPTRRSSDLLRTCPALRCPQDDHRPNREASRAPRTRVVLNRLDFVCNSIERACHDLVHGFWLMTFHKIGLVAIPGEKLRELCVAKTAKYGRIRDLVTVQMQNR